VSKIRSLFVLLTIIVFAAGCGSGFQASQPVPSSSAKPKTEQGVRLTFSDGHSTLLTSPVRMRMQQHAGGLFAEFGGRGYAWAIPRDRLLRAVEVSETGERDIALSGPRGQISQPSTARRISSAQPYACYTNCDGGSGTGGCDAMYQSCGPCPMCSGPQPSDGDQVPCVAYLPCGEDNTGITRGVGIFFMDDQTTCNYNFETTDVTCTFENANPRPSRPSNNLSMGWLHEGPSARLACDITQFARLPVTADATYKDSTGQVFTKFRHDGIEVSPDYWFVPDETGKPLVPPPPAKASVHATYNYFGIPFVTAGQCYGQDSGFN
jgi:hypothetical protein